MPDIQPEPSLTLDLLYPFYLDTDMSMAFAAALAGGVALEEEQVDRSEDESRAVRNLRGSIKAFRAVDAGASRETGEGSVLASESRLVRRHNMASIFIDLYDELSRTGRLVRDPQVSTLRVGEIVSLEVGPAVAPLRRVVDQIIRLLDLVAPFIALSNESDDEPDAPKNVAGGGNRQQRRQAQRELAKQLSGAVSGQVEDGGPAKLLTVAREVFVSLREDLSRSGMVDIVVARGEDPDVILTLDGRFLTDSALELLHTSGSTVVGKVTQIWLNPTEMVNLQRRSAISLLPGLGMATVWGIWALLGSIATNIDVDDIRRAAFAAIGADESGDPEPTEIRYGDDVQALNPVVAGPAFQVLPLAICA
jgi:hypothetical protein